MEKKKQTEGTVFISEADQYLFAQGTHYDIYKKLGAHPSVENGRKGTYYEEYIEEDSLWLRRMDFEEIYQDDGGAKGFAFGLGKGDSVRLFEDGEQIAAAT